METLESGHFGNEYSNDNGDVEHIEMENNEKKFASMMRAGLEEGELESFDARYPPDPSRKQIKNVVSKIIQAHEKGDIEQLITHNMEFSKITKVII